MCVLISKLHHGLCFWSMKSNPVNYWKFQQWMAALSLKLSLVSTVITNTLYNNEPNRGTGDSRRGSVRE